MTTFRVVGRYIRHSLRLLLIVVLIVSSVETSLVGAVGTVDTPFVGAAVRCVGC